MNTRSSCGARPAATGAGDLAKAFQKVDPGLRRNFLSLFLSAYVDNDDCSAK